jgi:hypothetical protein
VLRKCHVLILTGPLNIGFCTGTGNPYGSRVWVHLGYGYGLPFVVPIPSPVPSLRVLIKIDAMQYIMPDDINILLRMLFGRVSKTNKHLSLCTTPATATTCTAAHFQTSKLFLCVDGYGVGER